jgi:hypothetical protein
MADYKFFKNRAGTENVGVIFKGKEWIPLNPDNTDYQEYLKWVDEGNTAEAAD